MTKPKDLIRASVPTDTPGIVLGDGKTAVSVMFAKGNDGVVHGGLVFSPSDSPHDIGEEIRNDTVARVHSCPNLAVLSTKKESLIVLREGLDEAIAMFDDMETEAKP